MADRAPPSPVAMLIGTAIISIVTGYMIGIASSLGFLPIPFATAQTPPGVKKSRTSGYDDEEESSEEEIEGGLLDHAPNWANGEAADRRDGLRVAEKPKVVDLTDAARAEKPGFANNSEECKLVLVVRTDLGMTKGKSAALSSPLFN
jgi:PTH2 family peptidyl-tRNA hydrolase